MSEVSSSEEVGGPAISMHAYAALIQSPMPDSGFQVEPWGTFRRGARQPNRPNRHLRLPHLQPCYASSACGFRHTQCIASNEEEGFGTIFRKPEIRNRRGCKTARMRQACLITDSLTCLGRSAKKHLIRPRSFERSKLSHRFFGTSRYLVQFLLQTILQCSRKIFNL